MKKNLIGILFCMFCINAFGAQEYSRSVIKVNYNNSTGDCSFLDQNGQWWSTASWLPNNAQNAKNVLAVLLMAKSLGVQVSVLSDDPGVFNAVIRSITLN